MIDAQLVRYFLLTFCLLSNCFASNTCDPKPTQKNTTNALIDLRIEMVKANIGIYVIFSDDEHGSEYTQPYDKRRDWISGFRGSAGTAVVSSTKAAVWTDSRYFTQAEEELDCRNWLLMKTGEPNVPSMIDWIVEQAKALDSNPGTTTRFTSSSWWSSANNALSKINKQLRSVDDLVGKIWPVSERPSARRNPIREHDIKFAGESVQEKLARVAKQISSNQASIVVISSLDEIAWLFNLRGDDIPNNPFFKSYAIIYADHFQQKPELFLSLSQPMPDKSRIYATIFDYNDFSMRLNTIAKNNSIDRVWVSPSASQEILNNIPESKIIQPMRISPVQSVKARKNRVEREGMRNCQVRDAVARIKHLAWLENQLDRNISINETGSSDQLLIYQQEQEHFQGSSFKAISASGDRAAVVHYSAEPETARAITKDKIYLLDAGGQYSDCTTDITRTHHFGTPTSLEKRAYTRVLQGVLNLADAIFPVGTMGGSIDFVARMDLYKDGMTFGHGVGHGIGHYLSVHEGPQRIATVYNQYEEALADGMFLSDEPGYYKPGDFGIRIENDIEVVIAKNSSNSNPQFLRFETITLVPYEISLIDTSLLTKEQIVAINRYHDHIRKILSPKLKDDTLALNALKKRTTSLSSITSAILPTISLIFATLMIHFT